VDNSFGRARRNFIKGTGAAIAGSVLVAGFGQAFAQGTTTRLKVALTPPSTQTTLGFQTENSGTGPLQPMFEMLVARDRLTGELGPMLADSWTMAEDGLSWTFKLRQGVTFHDGSPFVAADVVFSWEQNTSEESRVSTANVFRKITAVEVVSDSEVILRLESPEIELPYFLTQAFLIYSKAYWDKVGLEGYRQQPVGTGPFKFKEFREGEFILYERVEDHWRQTPEFAELQLFYMPEDTTRLAALLTGEVHIAEIPRSVQNQAMARGKEIARSTGTPALVAARFGGNNVKESGEAPSGPLTDPKVREAMNIAVNREEINEQFFAGRGEVAIVDSYRAADAAFDPSWQPYVFDPERAKALLAEAGYADGFDFDMTVVNPPGFPEIPSVVEAMAIYFTNIGLRPHLVQTEVADQNKLQRARDLNNTLFSNRQSVKPLFQAMEYFWTKGIYGFFEDAYLDEQVNRMQASLDVAERDQIIKEIGAHLHEVHSSIPLLYIYAEVATDPSVVAEYTADIGAYGASVGHEYTKAAS